jgi:serine/threonine protein kinase
MRAHSSAVTRIHEAPVQRGDVVGGRYKVDSVLGSGGMGMVVRAEHVALGERVAIKLLRPGIGGGDTVARFEQEARTVAKIKGDHVARVIDLGTLDDGAPYIVMEYLDGEDLEQRVKRRGALPVDEVIDFVTQACEAMAEAHALGIVHRDLKTSNLFVVRRPDGSERIKVLDFGIAKVVDRDAGLSNVAATRTFAVMGSPMYMSPEQLRSTRSVDARTDVWSLGVILYELLAGRMPFEGADVLDLYAQIATGAPAPLERPDLPDGLEAVVLRCLAKSKEDRYPNVAELAVALAQFGPRRVADAAERVVKITEAAACSRAPTENKFVPRRTTKALAFVGAAAAAAVLVFRSCGAPPHAGALPATPHRMEPASAPR